MDYKVLYRKYRPSDFSNVVGQDYTVKMLKNAIINDKISHAYLFTGPRGTGKTSTAKIFAKTINCENLVNGEACGKCNSCLNFNSSADIIEIDAASNNGVDDIRELINNVKIAPSEGRYKIYIIDEVHMMTQNAFNALLLTLEEPPAHAIFIMATTNVESVPITILSRCQRFNFKKIALEDIKNRLAFVCQNEGIKITDEALSEVSYLAEGGLRDALSLIDQLSSDGTEITLDKILVNYGSISSVFINKMVEALENNDALAIVEAIKELENNATDYKVFVKKLIAQLVQKAIKIKNDPYSQKLSYEQIKNLIFDLNDCLNKVNVYINPFVLIQLILLKYINKDELKNQERMPKKEINGESKNKESQVILEQNFGNEIKNSDTQTTTAETFSNDYEEEMIEYLNELKMVRINNCFVNAHKKYLTYFQNKFQEFAISDIKPEIKSLLIDAKIVLASPEIVVMAVSLESTVLLINRKILEIEKSLANILGENIKLIAVSEKDWNEMKEEYIKNLKNGVKYEMIDEDSLNELKPTEENALEEIAKDLFSEEKIEIID